MSNYKINTTGAAMSAVCLSLALGAAHAAPLVNFSNGAVADADDVNANFNELATRIETISLTAGDDGATGLQGPAGTQGPAGAEGATGPQGPAGPQGNQGNAGVPGIQGLKGDPGAQGPAGNDGAGVVNYSWSGTGANAWDKKIFIVSQSDGISFDKEVRSFDRSVQGFPVVTRERFSGNTLLQHRVLHYELNSSGFLFNQADNYIIGQDGVTVTLQGTTTITPGIITRHNNMGLGMNWASASQIMITYEDVMRSVDNSFAIDSRSLLAIEGITVQNVEYTGCQKIMINRDSTSLGRLFKRINWYCPGGIGLVKSIHVNSDGRTRMLELDPVNSVKVPAISL